MNVLHWWWAGESPPVEADADIYVPRPMARTDREVYARIVAALGATGLFDLVTRTSEPIGAVPNRVTSYAHVREGSAARVESDPANRNRRIVTGVYSLTIGTRCAQGDSGRTRAWDRLRDMDAAARYAIEDPDGYDGIVVGHLSEVGNYRDELSMHPDVAITYAGCRFVYVRSNPRDLLPPPE